MTFSQLENLSEQQWHQISIEDVAKYLKTDLNAGLPAADVSQRQEAYGFNELKGKKGKSAIARFLMEFNQPLIYILLFAGVITLLLKDWVDAGVILGVTVINAVIGFIQESKAEDAIAALAKSVSTEATVIRDGQKVQINSRELVIGDLVLLSSGDKVPADLRLVTLRDLQVSEAALTGESVPVQKNIETLAPETVLADRLNMVYATGLVTFGQAKGIVVAIANETETGRISQLIEQSTNLETPLTRKIKQFSKKLLYVILGLSAFAFVVVIGKGGTWTEGFKGAVALAVSAIPEGLPAVVTVTLAIGVGQMANRHAIIRKLPAVETLGSTTVICSDKTGTLTENQMTVQGIYAGEVSYVVTGVGYQAEGVILENDQPVEVSQISAQIPALQDCLQCGLLCNDSHLQEQDGQLTVVGDPTEAALIVSANKAGLTLPDLEQTQPRLDTIPFESQFQYMATLHQHREIANFHTIYVKGSAEAILKRASYQVDRHGEHIDLKRSQIEQVVDQMASQGLRVLAFAKKEIAEQIQGINHDDIDNDLGFLGLQGMIDPPRTEAIAAVRACQSAGIQVKMITGDHALTAAAIAKQMGLSQDQQALVFTGKQLGEMDEQALANAVEASNVFARVAPEQKLRLVEALQAKGEIVAMTGDGVNDAPALKQADIGIAMGITGTEVAKEAADMVLTDDNFASIEAAIEEGRTVYSNLIKTIGFILPVNGGEALTILGGILAAANLPILPVQILWVNMVSSVALSATLAFEPKVKGIMKRSPIRPDQPLLTGQLLWRILIISIFNLIAVFGMFEWIWQTTENINLARTMAVQTLVASESFYLLSISQAVPSLLTYLKDRTSPVTYIPAIGIVCVFILQIFFSQIAFINPLFDTQALSFIQALICIGVGASVVVPALLLNRVAPLR
ncbi:MULTISPECIES: cation-translocating P-type ATPase [Pseudanabaena]|uniref:cation-translocating P-type ATPase n=1 Tax=Pseudanabaena TaxID=1152 RepID=UPI00247A1BCC|nr:MULTISPECIES: HAD-IC family P-type ATPase [Pseudanabaena]MEA5489715.1 HAD-IC family P-type ATPase [Pseudanabaena sp. CCNP1317]WGS73874.1 HAD-IC family P-type ATPase [Pseudanabaena galeata CCNP1313]